jgi:class 3 adenylate cyclase
VAVVLFTDLVGSTELRGRLGEEAAEELRRRHDRLLAEAVEAHGGRVVKGLGDGIMASFAGASDGVAAAVAVQQGVDRLNRSGKTAVPLAVRVGLSAGDVTFEDADVHGTPVIEAARLCGAAAGGEILASEMVRWLARADAAQRFAALESLELKGLAEPVPVVRVEWEPASVPTVPLPPLLAGVGRIFVGREEALERLGRLWKETAGGERRMALLAGEPGVGKTRLAAELAARVHHDGDLVLAGRCDEDLGVPYQPFVEALRHFVDQIPTEQLADRLGRWGGELTRLVPELAERVGDLPPALRSDPETERYRLFDAVAAWLSASAAEESVLLVLDDLQWAAKPTLLLLRHVLRFSGPLRLLVVATYRDSDIGRGHPLSDFLADVRRETGVERFPLAGLDRAAVAAFIEAAAGHRLEHEAEQELPDVVWRETDGNPFFVAEVLRHLAESRAIEQRDGRWVLTAAVEDLGIPEGLRDVVGRRLSRLSDSANRVLSVAAVVGLEFEPAVVGRAGDVPDAELFAALEAGARSRLLVEVSGVRYRFAHALVRATLYDELSGPHRVVLHRKVAEAIEVAHSRDLEDHLPALAYHWSRASAPAADTGRAMDYAARAGDRALAQLAHDEAASYYRQALDLLDAAADRENEGRRVELLISLGEAQRRAGDPIHRRTLLQAATLAGERGDAAALARAALLNNRGFWSATGTVDFERIEALEAALGLGDPDDSPWRARLLANVAVELQFSPERDRRLALSDQALAMARRLGDPATLAHVVLARCSAIWEPSTAHERLRNTSELIGVAETLGDPALLAWGHVWRLIAATELGDVVESGLSLSIVRRLTDELGQPALSWVASYLTVGHLIIAGRLREAEALAAEGRDLGLRAGQPDAALFFGVERFIIRLEQGRLAELVDRLARVLPSEPSTPRRMYLALAYCEIGRDDDARRTFEPLASELANVPVDAAWSAMMLIAAAIVVHLRIESVAADLVELLSPYADHLVGGGAYWWHSVSWGLGCLAATLGCFDESDRRFAAAASIEERIGAPAWLARTRLDWARMLVSRRSAGDAGRARELLDQALATARNLGLAGVEHRALGQLRECP